MNEALKKFIGDVGILCETWTVVYTSFINQGMSQDDALKHTIAFMSAIFSVSKQNGGLA